MESNNALSRINQRLKKLRHRSPKTISKSAHAAARTPSVNTAGSISTLEPVISNSSTLTPTSEPQTGENSNQQANNTEKSGPSSPTSKNDSSKDLWREAFEALSSEEQNQLSSLIKPETKTNPANTASSDENPFHPSREGAESLIKYIEKREEEWSARRWKLNIRGHEFVPRDCINNIISCLTLVGNVGVQFAPEPASLVWPLIKGLMEVPVKADDSIAIALITAETLVQNMICGRSYEEIYLGRIEGELRKSLLTALVNLYVASLKLLCFAHKQLNSNTASLLLQALLNPDEKPSQLSDLSDRYSELVKVTQVCQSKITVHIDDRLMEFFDKFNNADAFVKENFGELFKRMDEDRLSKILDWISSTKEYDRHAASKKHRADNTCGWLLEDSKFKSWEQSTSPSLIWLQGTMGTGKTVLTSKVIDHLLDKSHPHERIVYYYCRRGNEYEDPDNVIRSLFRQLATPAQSANNISKDVDTLYKQTKDKASKLPIEICKQELPKSLNQYGRVTFIIDALDECKDRARLMNTIDTLLSYTKVPTRIFVSGRADVDIRKRLSSWPTIQTDTPSSGTRKDIERFVDQKVEEFSCWQDMSEDDQKEIRKKLLAKSNGMFQWVFLQTSHLQTFLLPEDVLDGIEKMPTELLDAYDHIYNKISDQKSQQQLLDRALTWIMYSYMPVTTDLILTGVRLSGDSDTMRGKITQNQLLALGHNMIVFDEDQGIWRFSHASVAEFVEKKEFGRAGIAHRYAAKVCLRYLMVAYDEPAGDLDDTDYSASTVTSNMSSEANEDALLDYSRYNWMLHVRSSNFTTEKGEHLMMILKAFLKSPTKSGMAYQKWHQDMKSRSKEAFWTGGMLVSFDDISPPTLSILPICYFGFDALFAEWWDSHDILSCQTTSKQCKVLLEFAATAKSLPICRKLVEDKAYVESCGRAGSALLIAVKNGSYDIVDLLLENETPLGLQSWNKNDAFYSAALHGRIDIVKRFLKSGVSIDEFTCAEGSALAAAAKGRKMDMARSLLKNGASVDLCVMTGHGSALATAVANDNLEMAQFLIDHGASVDLPVRGLYGSALAVAAHAGKLRMAQFLIENGASVDLELPPHSSSALANAATMGKLDVARLLLKNGASVDMALPGDFGSALAEAAAMGRRAMVRLLIEHGASINLTLPGRYGSALAAAACAGQIDMVKLLVDKGAVVDLALPGHYGSALAAAACSRDPEVVMFLVEQGATVDLPLENGYFGSALAVAAADGPIETVEYLLNEGKADVNLPLMTGKYGTALNAASFWGQTKCVKMLLDAGALVSLELDHHGFRNAIEASQSAFGEEYRHRDMTPVYWEDTHEDKARKGRPATMKLLQDLATC